MSPTHNLCQTVPQALTTAACYVDAWQNQPLALVFLGLIPGLFLGGLACLFIGLYRQAYPRPRRFRYARR